MMCTRPTVGSVSIKKSKLLDNRLLMAVDCGLSLTKVIFLKEQNKKQFLDSDCDSVFLTYGLFNNDDFEDAIRWVKKNAFVTNICSSPVHITGSGGRNKAVIVESILGLKTEYVDETLALIAGLRIGIEEIGFENLITQNIEIKCLGEVKSRNIDMYQEIMKNKLANDNVIANANDFVIYPCLIQVCGSLSKFVYFDKDKKGELIRCQTIGGHTLLGLGKCLFDNNNYDDIMELAIKGNRGNVDTQIRDILLDHTESPYGKYPPETALFPFGKCMDFNKGLDDYRQEDVAASLVALYCIFIIMEYFHMCTTKMVSKVFLTGNIFRCDAFQREIKSFLVLLPEVFDMKMLDFGYSRVLGAMLCNDDDKDKYCAKRKS